ncbi:hypothetical protein D5086_002047 [Populus alba]|uniref:Uncharacterized protein n=1 Tax=Populus alba TaxID=43335 RepID=A0ACC4D0E4_POPAL
MHRGKQRVTWAASTCLNCLFRVLWTITNSTVQNLPSSNFMIFKEKQSKLHDFFLGKQVTNDRRDIQAAHYKLGSGNYLPDDDDGVLYKLQEHALVISKVLISRDSKYGKKRKEGLRSKSSAKHKIHNRSPPNSFTESRPPSDWCRVSGNPLELQLLDYLFYHCPNHEYFKVTPLSPVNGDETPSRLQSQAICLLKFVLL